MVLARTSRLWSAAVFARCVVCPRQGFAERRCGGAIKDLRLRACNAMAVLMLCFPANVVVVGASSPSVSEASVTSINSQKTLCDAIAQLLFTGGRIDLNRSVPHKEATSNPHGATLYQTNHIQSYKGGRPPPTRMTTIKAGGRRQHGKPSKRREAATKARGHKEGGKPPPKWEAIAKAGGRHQHGRPW